MSGKCCATEGKHLTFFNKVHTHETQDLLVPSKENRKNTYGTVQSYNTSAQTLRYQACDPELEEDVLKPVSVPTMTFREKSTHFHGCDWSHVLPNQSHTSENNGFMQNHLSLLHATQSFLPHLTRIFSYGRQVACKHKVPRDTARTSTLSPSSTYSVCHSHGHAHATWMDAECRNLPPWMGAAHTKLSRALLQGGWLTANLRCVSLAPCVSWVWTWVTNIWMYSREGAGISNYKGFIQGFKVHFCCQPPEKQTIPKLFLCLRWDFYNVSDFKRPHCWQWIHELKASVKHWKLLKKKTIYQKDCNHVRFAVLIDK